MAPCILVIGEVALAADLITQVIFKHLERNLADPGPLPHFEHCILFLLIFQLPSSSDTDRIVEHQCWYC